MSISIRQATKNDADAIAHLIEGTHGAEIDSQHIQAVVAEDDHVTLIAEADSDVVGFVDNFMTIAQDGTRRCELDLLGVDVHFQNQGIGKQLIEASTQAAQAFGASLIRALVAMTNTPMQRAMTKSGYQQQPDIRHLYISTAKGKTIDVTDSAHLIPVTTLGYRGIWLEGEVSIEAIQGANAIREKYGWDVIGVVVPVADEGIITLVESAEFKLVSSYQWWHKMV